MNDNNLSSHAYSKYFQILQPISTHSSYIEELEYSDKIILPKSVSFDLQRVKLPSPYLFILTPKRRINSFVYCSPLEFTAEEEEIYLPNWIFYELGYKIAFKNDKKPLKAGYGINLHSLPIKFYLNRPIYTIPICSEVLISLTKELDTETIKRKLSNYSILIEGKKLEIKEKNEFCTITINKLVPSNICINRGNYQLDITDNLIKHFDYEIDKEEDSEKLSQEEKYDNFPDDLDPQNMFGLPMNEGVKLPKFLYEIMRKGKKPERRPKNESIRVLRNAFGLESFTLLAKQRNKSSFRHHKGFPHHNKYNSLQNAEISVRLSSDFSVDSDQLNQSNIISTAMQNTIEEENLSFNESLNKNWSKNHKNITLAKLLNKPAYLEISLPSVTDHNRKGRDKALALINEKQRKKTPNLSHRYATSLSLRPPTINGFEDFNPLILSSLSPAKKKSPALL